MRLTPQGERLDVKIGNHRNGKVAILKGIQAGKLVVISGQLKLEDGARVKVDPEASLIPPEKQTFIKFFSCTNKNEHELYPYSYP